MSAPVELIDVTPRDGLQNEATVLSPTARAELVRRIIATGARRIEAVSFVRDDLVPAMAGAEEVLAGIGPHVGVTIAGLVLNSRGMQRAADAGVDEVNFVIPATDAFAQANQNSSVAGLMTELGAAARVAADAAIPLTVTIAVAFGCPFAGVVPPDAVARIAKHVTGSFGVAELALADTIGVATPWQVREIFHAVAAETTVPLRAHFHDTRRTALANVFAALGEGVQRFDASLAGLGGCPFAPGAAGNVAMEDLAWMLDRAELKHGISVSAALEAGRAVAAQLGVAPRSAIAGAGPFPR